MDLTKLQGAWLVELAVDGGAEEPLPTEFRIFKAGVNESSKGSVVFDAAAARDVMDAYERGGVDLMIDLAHDSLDRETRVHRADADDARGWFQLEVRTSEAGPELWAVNVRWTPDGERRLRERTQRYISPAFWSSKKSRRVLEVQNVALCSMPATLRAEPLVAASKTAREGSDMNIQKFASLLGAVEAGRYSDAEAEINSWEALDPAMAKKLLDAVKNADGEAALAVCESLLVGALGASEAPPPAEMTDPASQSAETSGEPAAEDEEMAKLTRRFTGRTSAKEAERELVRMRAELDAAKNREAMLDASARRDLVADLVKLERELPATAWENPDEAAADPSKARPAKHLRDEPIESLRTRVDAYRAAAPATRNAAPPQGDAGGDDTPAGVDAATWRKMTAEQKADFREATKGWN